MKYRYMYNNQRRKKTIDADSLWEARLLLAAHHGCSLGDIRVWPSCATPSKELWSFTR